MAKVTEEIPWGWTAHPKSVILSKVSGQLTVQFLLLVKVHISQYDFLEIPYKPKIRKEKKSYLSWLGGGGCYIQQPCTNYRKVSESFLIGIPRGPVLSALTEKRHKWQPFSWHSTAMLHTYHMSQCAAALTWRKLNIILKSTVLLFKMVQHPQHKSS